MGVYLPMNPNSAAFSESLHDREIYGFAPLNSKTYKEDLEIIKMAFSIVLTKQGVDVDKFISYVEYITSNPESYVVQEEYSHYEFIKNIKEHVTIKKFAPASDPAHMCWRFKYDYIIRKINRFINRTMSLKLHFGRGMGVLVNYIYRNTINKQTELMFYIYMTTIQLKLMRENEIPFRHVYKPPTIESLNAEFTYYEQKIPALLELSAELQKKVSKGAFPEEVLDCLYKRSESSERANYFIENLKNHFLDINYYKLSDDVPYSSGWYYTNGDCIDYIIYLTSNVDKLIEQCKNGHVFSDKNIVNFISVIEIHRQNVERLIPLRFKV